MDSRVHLEKLESDNWSTWSRQFRGLLKSKKLHSIIDGTIKQELDSEKDEQVMGLIELHLGKYLAPMADDCTTAQKLWDKLEATFKAQNTARRLHLRRQLNNLKMEKAEPVTQYIARAKNLAGDLEGVGHKPEPTEVIEPVLAGLPEQYDVLVTVITASQEELDLDSILVKLLSEEQRINSRKEAVPIYAMRDDRTESKGNKQPNSNSEPMFKGKCNYCGIKGHKQADCRNRVKDQQKSTKRTVAFSASTEEACRNEWVIDSGASRHLTSSRQQLRNYRSVEPSTAVTFVNGQQAEALGQGEVVLQVQTREGTSEVTLRNVLHVPEATVNLFSTRQATNSGAVITFMNNGCSVSLDGTLYMEGISQEDGLLVINQSKEQPASAVAAAAVSKDTAELWHRRFGHLGYDNLFNLKKKNMVEGIPVPAEHFMQQKKKPTCEECASAKQSRLSFPQSKTQTTRPLELVHMDVCGPMAVPSHGGAEYLATFVDDYSRLSYVVPLVHKSEVTGAIRDTLVKWENQTGGSLKSVRTDRGGEYVNQKLDAFFRHRGVQHQTTAPYTPEQNGVAERLNRTLMERVRAMLFDNKLDDNLWAEAAKTASHIRNRSPANQSAQTPWELFYGSRPNVSGMRVFGAKAHAHVPKQLRHKLEAHTQKGIFIGYAEQSKAYRVLLDSGKVQETKDVIFVEDKQATGAKEAKAAAENSDKVSNHTLDSDPEPPNTQEDELGTDSQPSYSSGSEAAEEAAEEAAAEPDSATQSSATASLTAESSTQHSEQPRYPRRERKQPAQIYKAHAATEAEPKEPEEPQEPQTYEEALKASDAAQWKLAMDEEMVSLAENHTWTLEQLPTGVKAIPVKWVFKLKKDALGNIERYKARLVAKGFMQREGIDYNEVFAPVSKHTTLRTLLALAAAEDMEVHQLDIKTAFLNGELEETIYMSQPEGYAEGGHNTVCHLHKSLYGLKQAPRAWNTRLKQELEDMGFTASEADPGLFTAQFKHGTVYVLVYVDDILVAGKNMADIQSVKDMLTKAFKVRDLGEAKYFLGMSLDRDRQARTLKMSQERLATELVSRYGMKDGKMKSAPMSPSVRLVQATEENMLDKDAYKYSELVGSLLYLSVCTRPDIAQAVGVLTRHMAKSSMEHWTAAKGVLRYIAGTLQHGTQFGPGSSTVEGYCDSDYAADVETRRSTTGFAFILNGGAISWSSKLQPTVAVSTSEAEYMAAARAVKEALWLKMLLSSFGIRAGALKIYCDSQGAIKLLKHPIASIRTKHIDVIHHFARERVSRKEVCFEYCNTEAMIADYLTKALPVGKFRFCCSGMGVV